MQPPLYLFHLPILHQYELLLSLVFMWLNDTYCNYADILSMIYIFSIVTHNKSSYFVLVICNLQTTRSHSLIAAYLIQAYFHSEGHLALLYHGHALGSKMGMPVGINAHSCPWGSAHPRDRLHQMGPHEQMENIWEGNGRAENACTANSQTHSQC